MRDRAGKLVAVVSMDLFKASDFVQHDLLLAKLKAYGVGEGSCALLKGAVLWIVKENLESKGDMFTDGKRKLIVKVSSKRLF